MNTGTFAGYIGRDAELKTVGQSQVANFSLAVSTFKGGEKATLWISAALWGERASKLAPFLTKGSAVSISGDIDVRAYESKDGAPKAEIVCNVQRVTLQGGGERQMSAPAGGTTPAMEKTPQQQARERSAGIPTQTGLPTGAGSDFDDDIPF